MVTSRDMEMGSLGVFGPTSSKILKSRGQLWRSPMNRNRGRDYDADLEDSGSAASVDSTGKRKSFRRLIKRFAEKTSMQGVPYINNAKLLVAKIIWSILLVIAIVALGFHLWFLFTQFYGWPVKTNVQLGFSNLRFPDVTICNTNPIHRGRFQEATGIKPLKQLVSDLNPRNLVPDQFDANYNPLADTQNPLPMNPNSPTGLPSNPSPGNTDSATTRTNQSPGSTPTTGISEQNTRSQSSSTHPQQSTVSPNSQQTQITSNHQSSTTSNKESSTRSKNTNDTPNTQRSQGTNNTPTTQQSLGTTNQPNSQQSQGTTKPPKTLRPQGTTNPLNTQQSTQQSQGTTNSPHTQQSQGTTNQPNTQQSQGTTNQPITQQSQGTTKQPITQQPQGTNKPPNTRQTQGTSKQPNTQQSQSTTKPPNTEQSLGTNTPPNTQESRGTSNPPNTNKSQATTNLPNTQKSQGATDPPTTQQPQGTTTTNLPNTQKSQGTTNPPTTQQPQGTTTTNLPNTQKSQGTTNPPTTHQPQGTTTTNLPNTQKLQGTTNPPTTHQPQGTTKPPNTQQSQCTTNSPNTQQSQGTTNPANTYQSRGTTDPPVTHTTSSSNSHQSQRTSNSQNTQQPQGPTNSQLTQHLQSTFVSSTTLQSQGTTEPTNRQQSQSVTDSSISHLSQSTTNSLSTRQSQGTTNSTNVQGTTNPRNSQSTRSSNNQQSDKTLPNKTPISLSQQSTTRPQTSRQDSGAGQSAQTTSTKTPSITESQTTTQSQTGSGTQGTRGPRPPTPPPGSGPPPQIRKKRFVSELDGLNLTSYDDNYVDTLTNKELTDSEFNGQVSKTAEIRELYGELYMDIVKKQREELGHQIEDMLLDCTFNGRDCDHRLFRLHQTAEYGNCWILTSDRFTVTNSGPSGGLSLVLYLEVQEYLKGLTTGYGLRIQIHEPDTLPYPAEEGVFIPSSMETDIGLKMTLIDRIAGNYGECSDGVSFNRVYSRKYTRRACHRQCEMMTVVLECDCFSDEHEGLARTYNDSLRPCRSTKEKSCESRVLRQFDTKTSNCLCPNPCKEIQYTRSISSRQWPDDDYARVLLQSICNENKEVCATLRNDINDQRILNNNFVKLNIYYEDLNFQNITEEPEIATAQFLSDVGGAVGLWIGLSVLSMCEIIQLIVELVDYAVHRTIKRRRREQRRASRKLQQGRGNNDKHSKDSDKHSKNSGDKHSKDSGDKKHSKANGDLHWPHSSFGVPPKNSPRSSPRYLDIDRRPIGRISPLSDRRNNHLKDMRGYDSDSSRPSSGDKRSHGNDIGRGMRYEDDYFRRNYMMGY